MSLSMRHTPITQDRDPRAQGGPTCAAHSSRPEVCPQGKSPGAGLLAFIPRH